MFDDWEDKICKHFGIACIPFAVLEYASDLEDYPEKSYSFPITYQQNCNLAKTLHDFLKNSERLDDSQEPSFHGVFQFVSSRAIFTLGATFGLYEVSFSSYDSVLRYYTRVYNINVN